MAGWTIWGLFVLDYAVRLRRHRALSIRSNLLDLLSVALPVLRPLRVLRLIPVLGLLNRRAATTLRGKVVIYVCGATGLVVFCASLAVLDAERARPEANITTFGDSTWWAITTITTVGYGDHCPTTGTGRLIAILLMICGIALLGVVTATLASWLLERIREIETASESATRHDIEALRNDLATLHAEIIKLSQGE